MFSTINSFLALSAASHKLRYVLFRLSLASMYFFNFPFDISLTHMFRSATVHFYMFVNFPIFFLLLISSFTPLWSQKVFGMISVFFNLVRWKFVTEQHMLHPGKCSMCAWEEHVFCCRWMKCSIYVEVHLV